MTEAADFAIIGHRANWKEILSIVNGMRDDKSNPLTLPDVKSLFPALPPRSLFNIKITSTLTNRALRGKYIETFISPDHLIDLRYLKINLEKVNQAASVATNYQIPITTLGGFTSILLEGNINSLPKSDTSKFTTGNTLTAALVINGVKAACKLKDKNLSQSNLLIIGATGDLGSACLRYFRNSFRTVLLAARNKNRLRRLAEELDIHHTSTNVPDFIPEADVIIAVTSSKDITLDKLKPNVLIADAGYPKNIQADKLPPDATIFHAGMGYVKGGYAFTPAGYMKSYAFPYKNVGHGCVLEASVLAFENRFESYSAGRGKISVRKMEEILNLSQKHGIVRAPFYNNQGLWDRAVY